MRSTVSNLRDINRRISPRQTSIIVSIIRHWFDASRARRGDHGFTLLEVLVATGIAAAAFGVLWRAAATGMTSARDAGAYETALVLARSHLALLGRDVATMPQDSRGRDGAFDWHIRIVENAVASPGPALVDKFRHADEDRPVLYRVDISVAWSAGGHRRAIDVTTQRLGFLPPSAETP